MGKELATLPVSKISSVVNQLSGPVMAQLQENPEALRAALLRSLRLVACMSFPLCVGGGLVAKELVPLLLGEQWMATVPIFQILCLYAIVRSLDVLMPPVLYARYRARFLFAYTFALFSTLPLVFLLGALWFGPGGVAMIWITIYPLFVVKMIS